MTSTDTKTSEHHPGEELVHVLEVPHHGLLTMRVFTKVSSRKGSMIRLKISNTSSITRALQQAFRRGPYIYFEYAAI